MNFFRKKISLLAVFSSLLILPSCTWISKRKVLFAEEGESASSSQKNQTVTKTQYDQLLGKYENLLDKVKQAEKTSVNNSTKQARIAKSSAVDRLDMINELSRINPPADLVETVDVFGNNGLAGQGSSYNKQNNSQGITDSDVERQLSLLQRANTLVSQNKMDSALIILRDLEESSNKQVAVRAKFYLAEMLFRQNEYDLAMQMYEEVIRKHAFSGLVIKSLGRLIVCSDKLKLGKKKERYYSILHDFFEA